MAFRGSSNQVVEWNGNRHGHFMERDRHGVVSCLCRAATVLIVMEKVCIQAMVLEDSVCDVLWCGVVCLRMGSGQWEC